MASNKTITWSVCFIILSIIYQASTAAVALTTDAAAETGGVLYEHFEDYLVYALKPETKKQNEVMKPRAGSDVQVVTTAISDGDILGYFRDVPRDHWSCCMLGKLAADKGFHCQANFYASRITLRNYNRAHNRRMPFQGSEESGVRPTWGYDIMRTFSRCIQRHATEFHQCCHVSTTEKRERQRWLQYRLAAAK